MVEVLAFVFFVGIGMIVWAAERKPEQVLDVDGINAYDWFGRHPRLHGSDDRRTSSGSDEE